VSADDPRVEGVVAIKDDFCGQFDSAGITGTSLVADGGYIATAEPTRFEKPK
jgi:hypothetical protein